MDATTSVRISQWFAVFVPPVIFALALLFTNRFCNAGAVGRRRSEEVCYRLGWSFVLLILGYGSMIAAICQFGANVYGNYQACLNPVTAILIYGAMALGFLFPWLHWFYWPPLMSGQTGQDGDQSPNPPVPSTPQ